MESENQAEQTDNPAGRPERAAELRALAREHTETALAVLHEIATEGSSESARIAAANALLDRGWGKCPTAPQEIEVPEYMEYKITPFQTERPVN